MLFYRFLLPPHSEVEQLFYREDTFEMNDDDGANWLYVPMPSDLEAQKFLTEHPELLKYEITDIKEYVDWGIQWSEHSPDYQDFALQVDLAKYTELNQKFPVFNLKAGPGFGDLSHATTRLTLEMMAPYIEDKHVIDIGCGSGILTIAALIIGAKSACGIDIDSEALKHASENATLNGFEGKITFVRPEEFPSQTNEEPIILMNMIRSQQQEAWSALKQLQFIPSQIFTSGILITERDQYLLECALRGWKLISEKCEGEWMGFHWKNLVS